MSITVLKFPILPIRDLNINHNLNSLSDGLNICVYCVCVVDSVCTWAFHNFWLHAEISFRTGKIQTVGFPRKSLHVSYTRLIVLEFKLLIHSRVQVGLCFMVVMVNFRAWMTLHFSRSWGDGGFFSFFGLSPRFSPIMCISGSEEISLSFSLSLSVSLFPLAPVPVVVCYFLFLVFAGVLVVGSGYSLLCCPA